MSAPFKSEDSSAERLQKIIAQAGITSRRDAEEWISEGLVTVNGKVAKLGDKATLGKDSIKVKGKLILSAQHKVYYLFYKPKNVIAMVSEDEEGRPTIKDIINKQIKARVFTVGRMDFTGEGAIILTNDGEMAQKILKSTEIIRRYHVKVDRVPTSEEMARLARGGRIEGRSMQPHHVRIVETYSRNALIEISFQGMGSIDIRKFFENKGFFPEKVARVGIGHIKADSLKPGMFKRIEASSIEALLKQPELATRLINNMVKTGSKKVRVVGEKDLNEEIRNESRGARASRSERGFIPERGNSPTRPTRTARGFVENKPTSKLTEPRSNRSAFASRKSSDNTRSSETPRPEGRRFSAAAPKIRFKR